MFNMNHVVIANGFEWSLNVNSSTLDGKHLQK